MAPAVNECRSQLRTLALFYEDHCEGADAHDWPLKVLPTLTATTGPSADDSRSDECTQ